MFLLRKRFWITVLKLAAMTFPVALFVVQIPELRYDLGPASPVEIASVADLRQYVARHSTFVSIKGRGDFEKAFVYKTHGQAYLYFPVEPYGEMLIVRSYERPTDANEEAWRKIDHWVGRLQPIGKLAFKGTVLRAFKETYGVDVPGDAFYLARDDAPELSGWQIGALIYSALLFVALLYFFFIRPWRKRRISRDAGDAGDKEEGSQG